MLTQKVTKYIDEHKLCSEYLFDDWSTFLELLYAQGGCVASILWFERVRIIEQKNSLGAGGYRDKNNSEYMYAETHIYEENLASKSLSEVKSYIQSVLAAYPNNVLVPSFHCSAV